MVPPVVGCRIARDRLRCARDDRQPFRVSFRNSTLQMRTGCRLMRSQTTEEPLDRRRKGRKSRIVSEGCSALEPWVAQRLRSRLDLAEIVGHP